MESSLATLLNNDVFRSLVGARRVILGLEDLLGMTRSKMMMKGSITNNASLVFLTKILSIPVKASNVGLQ
jgi:hypothetical protein